MANDEREPDDAPDETHPIDPPVNEEERYRLDSSRQGSGAVTDAGRTMGGGSLGHGKAETVEPEAPLRNGSDRKE